MLARLELRRRWRSTVALALLVGAIGAIVLATAAGARRTDSSLQRFNTVSRSADAELSIGANPTARDLDTFRHTPGIEAMARLRGYALTTTANENLALAAPIDAAMGDVVDRVRLIKGRPADPAAPNELTIGEALAAQLHLHVGSRFAAYAATPAQVAIGLAGGNPGAPAGPTVQFRIVGIVRRPLDLGVRSSTGGVALMTPGFNRKYASRVGVFTDVLRVKTVHGTADLPRVVAAARKLWGTQPTFLVQGLGIETEGAGSAIDVLSQSLWIFAAVMAVAGLVAIGIVLTRDIANVTVDQSTLRSLGATRVQRVLVVGSRAVVIAIGGACVAGVGAVLASPLFPVGLARRADPDLGIHADSFVLLAGIALLGALVLAIALLAAWRATRRVSADRVARARRRTSPVVEAAARGGLRPSATNGLRMALQPGTGATAVPVRSAFAGAAFGVAGVVAVLVFSASLAHLVTTPKLSGWTWDFKIEVPTPGGTVCTDPNSYGIANTAGVAAVAAVCTKSVEVDGRAVTAWGLRNLRGAVAPTLVTGRLPATPRQIALGALTMRKIGRHIGDSVTVAQTQEERDYEIVGQIALPQLGDAQPLADGALMTDAGITAITEAGENETHFLLIALARGASAAPVNRRLAKIDKVAAAATDEPQALDHGRAAPVEVTRLQQIHWLPTILAALLATLALLAIGHALVTSVRRRRRELALLKTMGFGHRQLRATVAWQATTLAVIGLVVGLPIGLLVGNAVWAAIAHGLGVGSNPTMPVVAVALAAVGALVLANVIAFFPARAAARIPAAVALRSE
jgi:ABC-type lipoprotein release transport system permease subunit